MDEQRFAELRDALEGLAANHDPSSAQGILVGMLAGGSTQRARWVAEVLDGTAPRGEPAKRCLALLSELFEDTQTAMDDPELMFSPLVPDEQSPLAERAFALGRWCEGFVLGLGLAGVSGDDALPEEAREVVRDFSEIARIDPTTTADDDDEGALAELIEYARVGALLVREHVAAPAAAQPVAEDPPSGDKTLH